MKRKWQTSLSIILYIIILTCALDFNIFKLIDLKLIFLTIVGTIILSVPFYEKNTGLKELLYIFGRKSIDTGFIQTFLLLFARLQNDAGYERLMGDIALCFRPLLYAFCLYILLSDKADDSNHINQETKAEENTQSLHEFAAAYGLTRRETEITQLILHGKSNGEIAETLFISETTVKKHVSNIFEKVGINRREEIIIRIKNE